jgi:hypothetical protein
LGTIGYALPGQAEERIGQGVEETEGCVSQNHPDTVKKNPSKYLFSTEAGEAKEGFPSPIFVGAKRAFSRI